MDLLKRYIPVLFLLALVVIIQLVTQFTETTYYLTQLTMSAYYSVVVIGLCVLMGYGGQISLGHAGFFAIGGYLAGALTTHNLLPFKEQGLVVFLDKLGLLIAGKDLYGGDLLTVEPWAACITAVLTAGIIGLAIGGPVLKLKGHYLAMATLGFGIIIYRIALASGYFGEADGVSEVPGFKLLPGIEVSGSFGARTLNYYIAWGMVIFGVILLLNLIHSRVGRALRSIHGAEEAANAMGINTARYKLYIFVLSAVFAAFAGVFMTHYNGGIGPSEAGIMKSVRYVAIVAVGGMANLWGALIMGIVLNFLSLRGVFGSYDDAVFGVILIIIMLFAPEGILKINPWQKIKSLFTLFMAQKNEESAEN
ncbi:MAG: branched-chain amino acid ABC transporter permease [Desulfobulbaceae bacterium]|jgi:branched-chain amino acid transport system permease protein|nr:branched-chain amino acid ABC transporter permease [Desulfobulbaceae bacterium]MDH3782445.1 branched-chain amino acid ABC transporter permease [Desulfobulbaceae bacterium]MDH3866164.1 branched-chain amino acid ABC transporter permease [Desulfobulbaceae bacterium]MDH3996595.1 branched-chain amino acid ABC transporter permease [Desulfobulbaceae bacterium]HKJ15526.1 branched-chain amino acid ABC transporter permease [Desulfobulbales bacterium]